MKPSDSVKGMVYCTKCGTENPDNAVNCSKCGASLNPATPNEYRSYRHYHDDWYGRPHLWGIIIGLFIIMIGVSSLEDIDIWDKIWPMFIILVGVIIVANAFTRRH